MIMGEDGENGSMTVTDGVERKITLKEGDLIGIIKKESSFLKRKTPCTLV